MRSTLLFIIFGVFIFMAGNAQALDKSEQIKIFEQRIRSMLDKNALPIIDVEYHHGGKIEIERLISRMDENDVALTWLGPNERLGSEDSLRLNQKYPDRFVPTTVHGDGPLWHGNDKGFLENLRIDVRSGKYFAMGEFEARHYPSVPTTVMFTCLLNYRDYAGGL